MSDVAKLARALVNHVQLLEKIHRDGTNPTFGQIEDLFDYARRADRALLIEEPVRPPTVPCSLSTCGPQPAAGRAADNLPYCARHLKAMAAITTNVIDEASQIARERLAAMEHGRVAWPEPVARALDGAATPVHA